MRTLRSRLTVMFLLLIGLSMLGSGFFVALLLKASSIDSLADRLGKEGVLLADTINWMDRKRPEDLQKQAELYGHSLDARVTLIDREGRALADSEKDPAEMGNLSRFPEVKRALQNRTEDGFNRVTTADRLDVFIPVQRENRVRGAVRLSLDLQDVNQSLSQVWVSLIGGLAMAYIAAVLIGSRYASKITRPLEEITRVASDIARNKFHRRIPVTKRDEIGRLASAINRMAASLKVQLETIRKSERRLTSVIETMDSGLLMVDSDERIILANQAIHRFFNLKTSQLLRKPLSERAVFHDLYHLYLRCKESGEKVSEELHIYFPEERILEANLTPVWGETGIGVVAVLHDITAIRHLEQMRTEFVANVSHELKTPVTSLRGFAETLLDGAAEDPEMRREFLEIIHHESLRLERLIGDLLDLSKIESRKVRLNLEEVRADDLIQRTVRTIEKQIRQEELDLHLELEKSFTVRVDQDRFSQILINLLSNAMSYTPAGGSITLSAGKEEKQWWVQVADTGIGIPEEDQPRIFERFYRVDKARSRESGGTGLGLAIVKHLVEAHHGSIHLESRPGEGTCFTLYFPL
ncbi:two-component system histidine kinase PnpS [Paludifilum halophilum]|uniref:histidine kinase n=1 Tax=Paludifilum halophilum TaxID=1642702 RepID=A0A235B9Y6_9BACL|nr:ATP-binding protein [Paludifilum halophilum]OYD08395.1 hypothetical protein CHM34_06055 [Paludifilum halophilum]